MGTEKNLASQEATLVPFDRSRLFFQKTPIITVKKKKKKTFRPIRDAFEDTAFKSRFQIVNF